MNKQNVIIKNLSVAVVLLVVLVASFVLLIQKRDTQRCDKVVITVSDSARLGFVDSPMVVRWLDSAKVDPRGELIARVDLFSIRSAILGQPYVRSVDVNSTMKGEVIVTLRQNCPLIRVLGENGYNFYADTLGNILPYSDHYTLDVPLVTGTPQFSFAPNFFGLLDQKNRANDVKYLKKLINFVNIIEKDKFLSRLITQIYILPDSQIELITATDGQTIVLGGVDGVEKKLDKVRDFFAQAPRDVASGMPCRLIMKYKDQIILVKNQRSKIDTLQRALAKL
ncbi:MAG: hypothetical protein RR689_02910 [Mucinivorans sp.]